MENKRLQKAIRKQELNLKKIQKQNEYDNKFLNAIKTCIGSEGEVVNIENVKKWIEKGADVNSFQYDEGTALLMVLEEEPIKENLLNYLLTIDGIDVNSRGDTLLQTPPFKLAIELDDHAQALRVCKALLKKGAIYEEYKDAVIDAIFLGNHELADFLEQQLLLEQQILGQDV